MPKVTKILGYNKARAWESLGFAHKKRVCQHFDTTSYDLTGTDTHSSKHFKEWLGTRIGSRDRDMLWAHFPACRDGL